MAHRRKVPEDDQGQPKKRELGIVIPVEEGERWKLGAILFEGNDVLPDELLKNAFEEPKGGWLRADVVVLRTRSGVRLVASTFRPGHRARTCTSCGAASMTCSKLSSSSRASLVPATAASLKELADRVDRGGWGRLVILREGYQVVVNVG